MATVPPLSDEAMDSLAIHLQAQWRTLSLPADGACVNVEPFYGVVGGLWCRRLRGRATPTSQGAVLIEPKDSSSPLLLKMKGAYVSNWSHTDAEERALADESRILRELRAMNGSMSRRVLWSSPPFRLGGGYPGSLADGPLAILQERIPHSQDLGGRHSRSTYEPLLRAATGCLWSGDGSRAHCAARSTNDGQMPAGTHDGRMLVGSIAAELLLWANFLWREQLYVADCQFLFQRHGTAATRLFLFDPRASFRDERAPLFDALWRAQGSRAREIQMQRAHLLSLALNAALIAVGRVDVLMDQMLCHRCDADCLSRDSRPISLLFGATRGALEALDGARDSPGTGAS